MNDEMARLERQMAVLIERQEYMQADLTELKGIIKELTGNGRFVTRREFAPVQKIVYGAVGIILIGVIGALLALVVTNGGVVP